jgi:hypothetical protein
MVKQPTAFYMSTATSRAVERCFSVTCERYEGFRSSMVAMDTGRCGQPSSLLAAARVSCKSVRLLLHIVCNCSLAIQYIIHSHLPQPAAFITKKKERKNPVPRLCPLNYVPQPKAQKNQAPK